MAKGRGELVPWNVHVVGKSPASRAYTARPGIPLSRAAAAARRMAGRVKAKVGAATPASGIPPTPDHDLVYHGGKLISDLTYMNFYLGGASSWKSSDITSIDGALSAAMADRYLNNVMVQYFRGGHITSKFKGSRTLSGALPKRAGTHFLEGLIRDLFDKGTFDAFDLGNALFNFLLPAGIVLQLGGAADEFVPPGRRERRRGGREPKRADDSLHGLGGFHGSVHIPTGRGGTATAYFAIGAYSAPRPDGRDNGIVCFPDPWKNIVCTFYHELCEARTDPDVDDVIATQNLKLWGWADNAEGSECGDFPMEEVGNALGKIMQEVPLAKGTGKVPVQFQYSNYVHGPEGPSSKPRPFSKKIAPGAK
jgi:hypothetical protein